MTANQIYLRCRNNSVRDKINMNKYFHGGNMIVDRFQRRFTLAFILDGDEIWQEREQCIWKHKSVSLGTEVLQSIPYGSAHRWST
jgi:hypothetical protein